MRIYSVEVKSHHPEDDSTTSLDHSEFTSGGPHASTAEYEKTVSSLTSAMTELHTELRDKTTECEALYETARNLSHALQESDTMYQEAALECERLQMKLQMVTFYERGDEMMFDTEEAQTPLVEEPEEVVPLPTQEEVKKRRKELAEEQKKTSKKKLKTPQSEESEADSILTMPSSDTKPRSAPVCVDDVSSDDDDDSDDDDGMATDTGPRQAHFYHVIQERDQAAANAKKLQRELRHTRKQLREARVKLGRSNTLCELSYKDKQSDATMTRKSRLRNADTAKKITQEKVPAGISPLSTQKKRVSWLRKNGLSVRSKSNGLDFITEDEMLSPKWNRSDPGAMNAEAEQTYLKAMETTDDRKKTGDITLDLFQI